jgi:hypothetical protein
MNKTLLFTYTGQSLLIWMFTNMSANFLYLLAPLAGIEFKPFLCHECDYLIFGYVAGLGLIFSFPSILFLVPVLYFLTKLKTSNLRLLYATASIITLCVFVIGLFITVMGTDSYSEKTVITFLTPYVFGAAFSFWMMTRNVNYPGHPCS